MRKPPYELIYNANEHSWSIAWVRGVYTISLSMSRARLQLRRTHPFLYLVSELDQTQLGSKTPAGLTSAPASNTLKSAPQKSGKLPASRPKQVAPMRQTGPLRLHGSARAIDRYSFSPLTVPTGWKRFRRCRRLDRSPPSTACGRRR